MKRWLFHKQAARAYNVKMLRDRNTKVSVNAGNILYHGSRAGQNPEQPQQISTCVQKNIRKAVRFVCHRNNFTIVRSPWWRGVVVASLV